MNKNLNSKTKERTNFVKAAVKKVLFYTTLLIAILALRIGIAYLTGFDILRWEPVLQVDSYEYDENEYQLYLEGSSDNAD